MCFCVGILPITSFSWVSRHVVRQVASLFATYALSNGVVSSLRVKDVQGLRLMEQGFWPFRMW